MPTDLLQTLPESESEYVQPLLKSLREIRENLFERRGIQGTRVPATGGNASTFRSASSQAQRHRRVIRPLSWLQSERSSPSMSLIGSNVPGRRNSRVVPTASPTARPSRQPLYRLRVSGSIAGSWRFPRALLIAAQRSIQKMVSQYRSRIVPSGTSALGMLSEKLSEHPSEIPLDLLCCFDYISLNI